MARCYPFVTLLILAEVIATLQGAVIITGPSNITAQEGTNVQVECSVTGLKKQPLLRWRISGREYTPSTLPDRYFPSSTGLLIYSTSLEDDGVTVQCYIVLYDPSISPPYVVINSSVGVVHVIPRDHTGQVSSYNHFHDSTPTITPTPYQSTIITTFPSTNSSSLRQSFSISAIFLVVAILTLILTSTVVLCLVLHLIKTRGPKASSATPKTLLTIKIVHG